MLHNNNQAVIRRLISRSFQSNKKRNVFIVLAISITTLLIAFVFSVGFSLVESVQINEIRYSGFSGHAGVGHPSAEQVEKLKTLGYVRAVGTNRAVAQVKPMPELEGTGLNLMCMDAVEWEKMRSPAYTNIVGTYPKKEDEIMMHREILEKMGIKDPVVGMEIPLEYDASPNRDGAWVGKSFRLSGWFTNYVLAKSQGQVSDQLVSEALADQLGKTTEKDGSADLIFDDGTKAEEYCERLKVDLAPLSEDQPVAFGGPATRPVGMDAGVVPLLIIAGFLVLTGYLLIYNVLYISVSKDVRFYGLLKTLGATPRQIRKIVLGQILGLCLVGIPAGAIVALLLSLALIPLTIAGLGAVTTDAVVSFSPVIYLGAAALALLTAVLGALKPAKKAAGISPIEAQKFTGAAVYGRATGFGLLTGPYKMAFRNMFRDKKRAAVVFSSLFLGLTTLIAVTAVISGMSLDERAGASYKSDIVLRNYTLTESGQVQKFDEAFLNSLKALPGFENMELVSREWMQLDYSPEVFGAYITDFAKRVEMTGELTAESEGLAEDFLGSIAGISKNAVLELNKTLEKPIDAEAFERGEIVLLAGENPDTLAGVRELHITPYHWGEKGREPLPGAEKRSLPVGGLVPSSWYLGGVYAPTVYVSQTLMDQLYGEPFLGEIDLNVAPEQEREALKQLRQLIGEDEDILVTSKLEAMEALKDSKAVLFALGGGISSVIALVGILNFINVMSVGILVRKRELATLESVGMTKGQVRRLLTCEGLGYALGTLFFVLTLGTAITMGLVALLKQQSEAMVFQYPVALVLVVSLAILAICTVTPTLVYRSTCKATVVERLRETE